MESFSSREQRNAKSSGALKKVGAVAFTKKFAILHVHKTTVQYYVYRFFVRVPLRIYINGIEVHRGYKFIETLCDSM